MMARRGALAFLLATMWLGARLQTPGLEPPALSAWIWASGAALFALLAAFVARASASAGLAACVLVLTAQFSYSRTFGDDLAKVEGMPAAAALAYLLVAARTGTGDKAAGAARAVIGAGYTVAGACKLLDGGAGWINDYSIRVLAQAKALESTGTLAALRLRLANSPEAAWWASLTTVALELSGAAMLSPRARPYYSAALLVLHAGMYLGLGIMFWNWAAVVVLFGLWPEPERAV